VPSWPSTNWRARVVQLQLLRAGEQRAEMAEQPVLRAAGRLERRDRAAIAGVIAERAGDDRGEREHAHGPRQPRQIAEAAEHDRAVHHQVRQREEQHRHVGRVVGEHRLHGRRADPLDVAQLGRADAPREMHAQPRHRVLRQPGEQRARHDPRDERDHRAQREAPRERRIAAPGCASARFNVATSSTLATPLSTQAASASASEARLSRSSARIRRAAGGRGGVEGRRGRGLVGGCHRQRRLMKGRRERLVKRAQPAEPARTAALRQPRGRGVSPDRRTGAANI
jgi:hypothetical protein